MWVTTRGIMMLAPIGISVYTRLDHFMQCIEALQNNELSELSEIFIYSDASSSPQDEEFVNKVRGYSYAIRGFRNVHVIERESNYGGTQNASMAHMELTRKYGKSIFLEDDIVVAPGFLRYMNEAIEFYKDDMDVISVTGYCPPIKIPEDYVGDVFILPRFNGWGSGITWEKYRKYLKSIDAKEYKSIDCKNRVLTVGGKDVLAKIDKEVKGELDANDVKMMYQQAVHQKYTLYPVKSLVQNVGFDGSGVHCGKTNRFYHEALWDKKDNFVFLKGIKPDAEIVRENYKFRSPSIMRRVVLKLKRKFGGLFV